MPINWSTDPRPSFNFDTEQEKERNERALEESFGAESKLITGLNTIYSVLRTIIKVHTMHALETSKLLTEEYSAKILLATMGKPKSAKQLSKNLDIPIAACYRKIKQLEKAELIFCVERKLNQSGKRVSVYKSKMKSAKIMFERGKIKAKMEMRNGTTEEYNYKLDPASMVR